MPNGPAVNGQIAVLHNYSSLVSSTLTKTQRYPRRFNTSRSFLSFAPKARQLSGLFDRSV